MSRKTNARRATLRRIALAVLIPGRRGEHGQPATNGIHTYCYQANGPDPRRQWCAETVTGGFSRIHEGYFPNRTDALVHLGECVNDHRRMMYWYGLTDDEEAFLVKPCRNRCDNA